MYRYEVKESMVRESGRSTALAREGKGRERMGGATRERLKKRLKESEPKKNKESKPQWSKG